MSEKTNEAALSVELAAEAISDPTMEDPIWLDAAWVSLALPSGSVTREYIGLTDWEDLPTEVQTDAVEIVEALPDN